MSGARRVWLAVVTVGVLAVAAAVAQGDGFVPPGTVHLGDDAKPVVAVRAPTSSGTLPPSCADGSYRRSWGPWLEGCPGFVRCEPGFYCTGGVRAACLPGHYGASPGLTTPTCDGPCDAGFFCQQFFDDFMQVTRGSLSAQQHDCGDESAYCVAGSVTSTPVSTGHYTVSEGGANGVRANATRSGETVCEVGHYCSNGIKQPCPAGRYGATEGLTSAACSGVCQEGFYCPSGSIRADQTKCDVRQQYCPAGSGSPTPVFLGVDTPNGGEGGYYSVGSIDVEGQSELGGQVSQTVCPLGHYCRDAQLFQCPAGRYGSERGATSPQCAGECEPGYYCPAASVSPRERRCGAKNVYCPAGSVEPTAVSAGFYTTGGAFDTRTGQSQCAPGSWCFDGERQLCSKGRYGSTPGATHADCDGPCAAGYWCGEGSSDPQQHVCGSPDVYCPPGSTAPHPVFEGYYTVRVEAESTVATTTGEVFQHPASLTQFQPDELNSYPPDTVENSASAVASTILSEIRLNTSTIRTHERMCEEGYYCQGGVRRPCEAGLYGNERQMSSPQCSGNCSAGYYCPLASTRPDQVPCGSASRYCPPGSSVPTDVTPGFYTVGSDDPTTRSAQEQCAPGTWCEAGVWVHCPAGSYGATPGLTSPSCSGTCEAGYYCPTGSTSATQLECGNHTVFCPAGSARPVPVATGSYTAGGRNTRISATEGMYCRATYGILDTAEALYAPVNIAFDPIRFCTGGQIGDNTTRSTQIACEPGYFCVDGLRYECHPATYGSAPSLSDPACTGTCPAGWYCPWASTSPLERECGGPHVYCPELSGAPTAVDPGHYTATDRLPAIRTRQVICEPGHYCVGGLRFVCPARRFGATPGLTNALCSGICSAGHYCPERSLSDRQQECGGSALYCPVGSQVPLPVARGFYTIGGVTQTEGRPQNTTRDWQLICEPGHYCEGGIKRQCPSRVYGNVTGLATAACSGVCPAGHFCPPGTVEARTHECGSVFLNSTDVAFLGQGDAINGGFAGAGSVANINAQSDPATYIAWESGVRVRRPTQSYFAESIVSIHSFQLDGGASSVFCPEASDFPAAVTSGYYSIGGADALNMTREAQLPCESGFFCVAGRKYPCPPGTFGTAKKLTSRYCSGWCPPGFYCPLASPTPIQCPFNTYSTGGSPVCLTCPTLPLAASADTAHVQERCRDSRLCCNY